MRCFFLYLNGLFQFILLAFVVVFLRAKHRLVTFAPLPAQLEELFYVGVDYLDLTVLAHLHFLEFFLLDRCPLCDVLTAVRTATPSTVEAMVFPRQHTELLVAELTV